MIRRCCWPTSPTGELDAYTEASALNRLRDRADRGTTVVIASHRAAVAAAADRIIALTDGVLVP